VRYELFQAQEEVQRNAVNDSQSIVAYQDHCIPKDDSWPVYHQELEEGFQWRLKLRLSTAHIEPRYQNQEPQTK